MDRDRRWDRTQRAWRMLRDADGHRANTVQQAIQAAYHRGQTDEFVEPTLIGQAQSIEDTDTVIAYNFRPDRMRQIVAALGDPDFDAIPRPARTVPVYTMTRYDERFSAWGAKVLYPRLSIEGTLGHVYAEAGLRQLRVAETEKYAHVTYFFNGGSEPPLAGEDRKLVPSPKVATYDLKPEMSAAGVAEAAAKGIRDGYDLVVVNLANADMVGHTGKMTAAVAGCQAADAAVGTIARAVTEAQAVLVVTADHGNAETMQDSLGQPMTAHTTAQVPLWLRMPDGTKVPLAKDGSLSDVAPTILRLVGLEPSAEMTGRDLRAG